MLRSPLRSIGSASAVFGASPLVLYLAALCQPILVAGIKLISSDASTEAPFVLFGGAVALAAAIGGVAAGIASVALSATLASLIFMPPAWSLAPSTTDVGLLALFTVEGLMVSMIVGSLRARVFQEATSIRLPLNRVGGPERLLPAPGRATAQTRTNSIESAQIRRVSDIQLALFTDEYDPVTARVLRFPLGPDAAATLVRILPPSGTEASRTQAAVELQSALDQLAPAIPGATMSAELRINGDNAEALAAVALQRPELLVLALSDARRIARRQRGTLEKVIRRTGVPVLNVTDGMSREYRRVLVAIESPTARSSRVVDLVLALTRSDALEVAVVHVLDGSLERRMARAGAPYRAILLARRDLRSTTRSKVTSWLGDRADRPIRIAHGDATEAILEAARHINPDLIALGVDDRWFANIFGAGGLIATVLGTEDADVLIVPTH